MNDICIIAEVGVNHDGSLARALELIEEAINAGADAVKFQAFTAERLDPPGRRRDMLKRLELTEPAFLELRDCAMNRIEFMATPFDVHWLEFLVERCGVRRLKLASTSITDMPLLRAAAATGLQVLLSTGMATEAELDAALSVFPASAKLTLMYCVSAYPTPVSELKLGRLSRLYPFRTAFGLSDHTQSTVVPALAAMLGITTVEKHLTYTDSVLAAGPDHLSSLRPDEFAEMVANVRMVKDAFGDGKLGPLPCEAATYLVRKEREAWRESYSETADTAA